MGLLVCAPQLTSGLGSFVERLSGAERQPKLDLVQFEPKIWRLVRAFLVKCLEFAEPRKKGVPLWPWIRRQ